MTKTRPDPRHATSDILDWVVRLAGRVLARTLSMPEPMVYATGAFVYAHVQAAEDRALKTFCPRRLLRRIAARLGLSSL